MDRKTTQHISEHGIESAGRYYGLYEGIVINNNDPEKRGRLQVKIPSVLGEQTFEDWIYGKAIFNGKDMGIFAIPSVSSGVWITFINGDAERPIWEMGWFTDSEISDEFKERYLNGITFKHEKIFIKSKEASIELFEDGKIEVFSESKIDIVAKGDISVFTSGGKIELKNSTQNLKNLLNELKGIIQSLKVAMNGTPISNSLAPDSFTQINLWNTKVNQLLK